MAPRRLPWRAMPYEPKAYVTALGAQGPAIERVGKAQLHDLMGNFAAATAVNSNEPEAQIARYRDAFRAQTQGTRDRLLGEFYGSFSEGGARAMTIGQESARNVGAGVVQYINNNFGAADLARVLGTTAKNWPTLVPEGAGAFAQSFQAVVPFLSAFLSVANWWQHRDDEREQREAAVNSASWLRYWMQKVNQATLTERFGVRAARARVRSVWAAPLVNEINRPLYAKAAALAVRYCKQDQDNRNIWDTGEARGCRRGINGVGNRAATELLGLSYRRVSWDEWRNTPAGRIPNNAETRARYLLTGTVHNENLFGEVQDSLSKIWAGIMNVGSEATPAAVTETVLARPVKRGAPTRERAAEASRRRAEATRARGKRLPGMSARAAQAANRREKEARKAARRAEQAAAQAAKRRGKEAPVSESSTGPALLVAAFLAAALVAKK